MGGCIMGWLSKIWRKTKALVSDFVDFVISPFVPDIPEPPEPPKPTDPGTTVNRRGAANTISVFFNNPNVRGSSDGLKIGGIQSHITASGTNNKYIHITYVLSVGDLHVLGIITNEDIDRGKTITTNTEASHTLIKYFYSYVDSGNSVTPDWHNDKNNYPGLSVVKIRIEYPAVNVFVDNMGLRRIPNFGFYGRGSSHLNPNNDWSMLSHTKDYLTSSRYGAGLSDSDINTTSFDNIISIYEVIMNGPFLQFIGQRYYRLNTNASIVANVKQLLWHTGTAIIYEGGQYMLRIDPNLVAYSYKERGGTDAEIDSALATADCSTYTIEEEDVIGGIQLQTIPQTEVPYQYSTSFVEGVNTTVLHPADPETFNKSLLAAFGVDSKPPVDNTHVKKIQTNGDHSQFAYRYLEGRINNSITVTVSPKHSNARVYDIIEITYPHANLVSNKFVITSITRNADMSLNISAKQYLLDANLGNKWDTTDLQTLIRDQNLDSKKALLSVPVGYGLENNTQIDEFLPNTKIPTISNLMVFAKDDIAPSGRIASGFAIYFDEIVEYNINSYTIEYKSPSKDWRLITTTYDTPILYLSTEIAQGITYRVRVSPISQQGVTGKSIEASVYIPFIKGTSRVIRKEFYVDEGHPWGQIVDISGAIELNENGGLRWCQLQVPPVAGHPDCTLGNDSQHDLFDSWDQWESADLSNSWITYHPLQGATSANVDAYYYETDLANKVVLGEGDIFVCGGKLDCYVLGYDNSTTTDPYATWSLGWYVYDINDVLLHTIQPDTSSPVSNFTTPSPVVGGIANQSYALPFFYIYGRNTSGSHHLAVKGYELSIYKEISKAVRGIDTSTLDGVIGARELDIRSMFNDAESSYMSALSFAEITNVTVNANNAEPKDVIGSVVSSTSQTIKVLDANTMLPTDAIIDITVFGVPAIWQVKDDHGIYSHYKLIDKE